MLFPPAALLLDFGGVLVESPQPQPAAPLALVQRLHELTGHAVPVDTIVRDIARRNAPVLPLARRHQPGTTALGGDPRPGLGWLHHPRVAGGGAERCTGACGIVELRQDE
jgi:hypothetical protein